jgi:hypothetical protein
MALHSWPQHFPVEQAHSLHSLRPISLSPRTFIPCSCLGIEWSKGLSSLCGSPPQAHLGCWILILHAYYSWSFAPRWLAVALDLLLYVVSLGKFVLPIFVIVSSLRASLWWLEWGKGWERPGSLWAPQRGCRILCESEPRDYILCLSYAFAFTCFTTAIYLLVEHILC